MDVPDRTLFLTGFGWAGVASLLTWLLSVVAGAALFSTRELLRVAF